MILMFETMSTSVLLIGACAMVLKDLNLHCSDSGRSKFLLKSAGPTHHQTSVSIHQKKAFGELYSTVMLGCCELKVYRSYAHFQFSHTNFNWTKIQKC